MKVQIDILVPLYNEAENISTLHYAIYEIFKQASLKQYAYQLIFINDGSSDNSLTVLQELSEKYSEVKYLSFSRNFGHQLALKAGLDYALGDIVISMDADMQHPPKLIPSLIKKWEEGYQVVGTIRSYPHQHREISQIKKCQSALFYRLLNLISDVEIKYGSADFRLLDKTVVEVIRSMKENEPFLRGIVPWVGFRQTYIPYVAQNRYAGKTKYTLQRMLQLAIVGVTSFSIKPLYFAVYLGFIFSFLSLAYIPYVIYSLVSGKGISGWASLIMTIVFFGGIQLIILGIIGIYVGKIFKQTKDRPSYIIGDKNF